MSGWGFQEMTVSSLEGAARRSAFDAPTCISASNDNISVSRTSAERARPSVYGDTSPFIAVLLAFALLVLWACLRLV
jgi:hypothetical protein